MHIAPKSRPAMAMAIFLSLTLMAMLDYVTGQELVFSCAYLLPVCLTAWWFGRPPTVAMAVISGVVALLVDEFDGYDYSNHAIEYWNAFACFLISLVAGLVLHRLKETLIGRKLANEELRIALAKLEASTAEIRKLQSGLQIVCAWTKRIKVDDQWVTPEEFLSNQLHLHLSHGISPEAYGAFESEPAEPA